MFCFASLHSTELYNTRRKTSIKPSVLHGLDPPCHPTPSNFTVFCDKVQEYFLQNSGLDVQNISRKSHENVHEAAKNFTKTARNIWDRKTAGKYDRFLKHVAQTKDVEIEIVASRQIQPPKPPDPTPVTASPMTASSVTASSSKKRTAKKAFEEKSDRAKFADSAKIRASFPPGAIKLAAGQVLKSSGEGDAYFVHQKMAKDPAAAPKAKKAIKLETIGKYFSFLQILLF